MEILKGDPIGSTALNSSPGDSLSRDEPGTVDYFDAHGTVVSQVDAVFICRWNVAPLPSDADHVLVLRVLSTTLASARARAASAGPGGEAAPDVVLVDFRRREAP
jgi:hypothetical protein